MRHVVHHQHDPGGDLEHQGKGQDDPPDPHPVQVLGGGDHQGVIEQPDDGQAAVQPLFGAGCRLVMIVGDTGHQLASSPSCRVVSSIQTGDRDRQVFGRGAFADPARGIVVRAVAGAEPAAVVAGAVADRHAAQMGADARSEPAIRLRYRGTLRAPAWCGWRRWPGFRGPGFRCGPAGRACCPVRNPARRPASISASVRWRMKTGLPWNRMVSCDPG